MKKSLVAAGLLAALALVGCESKTEQLSSEQKDVKEAQQEVGQTQMEGQKEISEAQRDANENIAEERKELSSEITDTRKDTREDVKDAQKDVAEERRDVSEAKGELKEKCQDMAKDGFTERERKDKDYQVCKNLIRF